VQFLHLDRSDFEKTPGQVLRRVGEFVEFHDSVAYVFEIVDDIQLNVSALERKGFPSTASPISAELTSKSCPA